MVVFARRTREWSFALACVCGSMSACGPMIELETLPGTTTEGGTTDPMVPPPPLTTAGPTTNPFDTTGPVADSGVFDSGGPWLDFPESCSTIEQNCPPGYKCMPWASDGGGSWNDTKCVPIVDDANAPGEACNVFGPPTSGEDDCDGTSMCWDVDPETNMGVCQPFCTGDPGNPTCANPCEVCPLSGDGNITLCFPVCDPLTQVCPYPGQGCYPRNEVFMCAPDASPPDAMIGAPCEFINVCPPGMACLDASLVPGCAGALGCCAPYCPFGGADPCPGLLPGTECAAWYEGRPPEEACLSNPPGVCVLPP